MKQKQLWAGTFGALGIFLLILDGKTALSGAQSGVTLCLMTVIPSLFPFFLLTNVVTGSLLGMELAPLQPLAKLFGLPKGGESLLIPALLGGYPMGAQAISTAYARGQLSRRDASRMLASCNNAGPAFLFGIMAPLLPEPWMAWSLWGIHIASAVIISAVFPISTQEIEPSPKASLSLAQSMKSAVAAVGCVCGWVICFRVVSAFLSRWFLWRLPVTGQILLTGLLEMVGGCSQLALIESTAVRYLICAGFLSIGGLCVTMQTMSVVQDLSFQYYFPGKAIQALISVLLAAAVILHIWPGILCAGSLFVIVRRKNQNNSRNSPAVVV